MTTPNPNLDSSLAGLFDSPGSVIDALGGTSAVAEALHIEPSAVSAWRQSRIPPGRYAALETLGGRVGVAVTMQALAELERRRAAA